ncbi:MAG: aminodeoxychorismate/anthranilate synthase component II [Deltaproteobacteria bacterium]
MRVVLVDNYDSYVFNLYQRIGELTGAAATVLRNDQTTVDAIAALDPTHLVLSPGPGDPARPAYVGVCPELVRTLSPRVPTLGVCLGHQVIGAVYGASIVREQPRHGKTSAIEHDGIGVLAGLPSPLVGMRYHSLVVDPETVPEVLRVTARTAEGIIMGLAHRTHPLFGLQFHPESIGTPEGPQILENFLAM